MSDLDLGIESSASVAPRKKNMGGRPKITLTDEQIQKIEMMAGLGISEEKIALILDLNYRTFRRRKVEEERIQKAIARGKAQIELKMSKTLYDMAVNDHNLGALVWYEKTRFGRSETRIMEHAGLPEASESAQVVVMLPDNSRGDAENIVGEIVE